MSRRPQHPGLQDEHGEALPHRLVEARGTYTYLYDAGEGPPIVLIHGYGDSADGWRRVVPGLLEKHRVIVLDVPPFGRSDAPEAPKLMEFYKEYFPELFEKLGVGPATVIGHSLGGAIALHLTLARPELVDRLGLVAPAGLGAAPPWWWHALTGYGAIGRAALSIPSPLTPVLIGQGMKRFLDWRLFHDRSELGEEIRHLVSMHSAPKDFDKLMDAGRCCIESYTGTLLEDSAVIDVPLWMVWGRQDGLVPSEHARAFAHIHPDADVHVFDDCGHYPHFEMPSRFNFLLREWIDYTSKRDKPRLRRAA